MKISLPGARGNLYYAACTACLAASAVGTQYSWTSPTLPKLQADDSWLPITSDQASWIGSLTALGTALGPFLGSWLVNAIGRWWTINVGVFINLLGWAVLFAAQSLPHLYLGRLVGGVGGGIIFMAVPMYIAEIAEPVVRGALGSLFAFFLVGGYLIEYVFGPYVSYTKLIALNFIPAVAFFLTFTLAPESPYYCLRKNDTSKAFESLSWLRQRKGTEEVQQELDAIKMEVQQSLEEKARLSDLMLHLGNRKGLILSCGMVAGQQFSGVNVVLFYAENIFIMAGTSFSSSISTMIIGIILFVAGGLAAPLARVYGMKNMFIFSAIGMAFFQSALGFYFYYDELGKDMYEFGWLPVTSLVGYILTYTVGFGPLPWAVMAEVFPSNVKALASAITASFCWFLGFLLTKFFHDISDFLGTYVAFFLFSGCCLAALIFTIIVLPDTRGMTLQDIQDLLNNRPIGSSLRKSQTQGEQTNGLG